MERGTNQGATTYGCDWANASLSCCYVQGDPRRLLRIDAHMCEDAIWYNVPNLVRGFKPAKPRPDVMTIAFSMESSVNYPLLNDKTFMGQFDVEQSYRVTAPVLPLHVPATYNERWVKLKDAPTARGFFQPPIPTADKIRAIVFRRSSVLGKGSIASSRSPMIATAAGEE
eukprot:jgi/Mesvir1/19022/Mv12789-RA.1